MKKSIISLYLLISLIFNSCEPPRYNALKVTRTYFNNSTNYLIKFLPYKNGLVISDSIKIFLPNTITLLENQKYNTLTVSPEFDFNYQKVTDSIIVTFNGIKKQKHQNIVLSPIQIPYLPSKERTIITNDGGSYRTNIIEQRKNYIEVEFTYTFTEQDYVDAEPIN